MTSQGWVDYICNTNLIKFHPYPEFNLTFQWLPIALEIIMTSSFYCEKFSCSNTSFFYIPVSLLLFLSTGCFIHPPDTGHCTCSNFSGSFFLFMSLFPKESFLGTFLEPYFSQRMPPNHSLSHCPGLFTSWHLFLSKIMLFFGLLV